MNTIEKKVMNKLDNYGAMLAVITTLLMVLSLTFLVSTVFVNGLYVFLFLFCGVLLYCSIKEIIALTKIDREMEEKK